MPGPEQRARESVMYHILRYMVMVMQGHFSFTLTPDQLGEKPSYPDHTRTWVDEDLEMVIAEALWPSVSHASICIASAGARLVDIHQGNSAVLELSSSDREALRKAFGNSDE